MSRTPPTPEREPSAPTGVDLPAPSAWPMITAFGIALLFAGLLTNMAVSAVGLVLALRGAVGWFADLFPAEEHEHVPFAPPAQRPPPVRSEGRRVARLRLGEGGHRVRIPERIHPYSSGLLGGLAGGVAMAGVACAFGILKYGSLWYPINLLAAGAMPALARADTATLQRFHGDAFGVALFAHGVVSLLVGLLFAVLLPMLPRASAFWGSLFSPILWTGLLYGTLRFVNPLLAERVDWLWFIASQVAFGLVCGYVVAHSRWVATMQTWPLAARAGVEAPGLIEREREESP